MFSASPSQLILLPFMQFAHTLTLHYFDSRKLPNQGLPICTCFPVTLRLIGQIKVWEQLEEFTSSLLQPHVCLTVWQPVDSPDQCGIPNRSVQTEIREIPAAPSSFPPSPTHSQSFCAPPRLPLPATPSNKFPPLSVFHHPSPPPPTSSGSVSAVESRPSLSSPLTELLDHVDHPN